MSGAKPTEKEIMEAIRKEGYLFEQEVADLLENETEYYVYPNWAYQDPDENKSREIDIRTFWKPLDKEEAGISVTVELICECKDNHGNPFVFFVRNKNEADYHHNPKEYLMPVDPYRELIEQEGNRKKYKLKNPLLHLDLDSRHYYYSQDKKAVQFCKIARDNSSWKAYHGGIYNSIFFPLAKALQYRKSKIGNRDDHFQLWFPMVVLSSDIYVVDVSEGDEGIIKKPHVSFMRKIDTESVEGRYLVDFVSHDYLESFIKDKVAPFVEYVCELAEEESEFVLNDTL